MDTAFQESETTTPITASWANDVNAAVYKDAGPTASRPQIPRKIGMQYFDTDLKMPIYCLQIVPTVIWVNSAGEPVA